jgi:hypothetical protein
MAMIQVDYENNAEAWWDAARALASSGRNPTFTRILNALELHDEAGEAVLRGELDSFLAAASELPGWDSGQRHAPHPITWDETTGGIKVGSVLQEWTPDEGEPSEWEAYVEVEARVDSKAVKLGTVVGVPAHLRGTARAAGGDVVGPYLSTWWADSSDWSGAVRPERRGEAREAIAKEAPRLWREAMALRGQS